METHQEPLSNRFARVHGSPGEAPRVLGLLRAFWPFLLVCFATGYLVRAGLPWPALAPSHVGILFVLVAAAAFILLSWGGRRLGNYLKGAKGEEWVARELGFLGAEYTVFNGLRLGGGKQNLDHVIVGPTGVHVVETKNWKGSVEFRNGRLYAGGKEPSRPPLQQVKAATAELIGFLERCGCSNVAVQPVLCFLETRLPEPVMNVNSVLVCTGARLVGVLQESFNEPLPDVRRRQVVEALLHAME